MTADEWDACADAEVVQQFLNGGCSDRKLRLFAIACVRPFWDLLLAPQARGAIEVTERFADGLETEATAQFASQASWGSASRLASRRRVHTSAAHAAGYAATPNVAHPRVRSGLWDSALAVHSDLVIEAGGSWFRGRENGERHLLAFVREVFGNPFRPIDFDPAWRTPDVRMLAEGAYLERSFDRLPVLADALQEAGCDSVPLLDHLRDAHAPHARGCWALDLILERA
ncbi:hypothetical protein R5W24_001454 [Gemmata sp. JC717]|uniref:Uncharacterized protein n=1 Tax=Gemmata algarum TaxID=2975278 RepID=A0ABU5EWC5_9BACT|nr:hypothetical protein [Gemmata algarum]MDY3552372.1 hypothetical protein [Gemmata algarum]MDY3559471.1 hypothetical protein [Gemmata algarum]